MVVLFNFSSILQIWYVEVGISWGISESPLDFEITRVDCIANNQMYHNDTYYWNRQTWANSVDPDQTPQNAASTVL